MKSPSIGIAILLAAASAAHALTANDITATALIGKTLTFQAANGTGLLPASGTWTGKFETNANRDFTITNQGGIVADYSSKFTAITSTAPTVFSLTSIYQNSGAATLTLSISGTQGLYALSCYYLDTSGSIPTPIVATQGGTFTIPATVVKSPEIEVREGLVNLLDGTAKSAFGSIKVGKKSDAKTYKITNKGKATLTNIKVSASGADKGDFILTKPGASSLPPGKSTTFKVSFKPAGTKTRSAAIKISSNDADENPFDIKLSGIGLK